MAAEPITPKHKTSAADTRASTDVGIAITRRQPDKLTEYLKTNSPFVNVTGGEALLVAALKAGFTDPKGRNENMAGTVYDAMQFGPHSQNGADLHRYLVTLLRDPMIKHQHVVVKWLRDKTDAFVHDYSPDVKAKRVKLGLEEAPAETAVSMTVTNGSGSTHVAEEAASVAPPS